MKLTAHVVRQFEQDQRTYGTKTALFNLFWLKAADDLIQIGVQQVSTRHDRQAAVED